MTRMPTILVMAAALAALVAATPGPPNPKPASPVFIAPAPPESTVESEPAPLLIPGRVTKIDSLENDRHAQARGQYTLARTLEGDNPGAALLLYRTALKLDPELPDVRYRMGLIERDRGQLEAALESFAGEVEHFPDHRDAARELGLALARGGQPEHAIAQLERLVKQDPRDGESWHALGYAYMTAQRPHDAERALRKAITLPPASSEEHRDLAAVLERNGRVSAAREQLHIALGVAPADPTSWFNLGNLERRAGRADSAVAAYRRAEQCDSTFRLAYQAEIQLLGDHGRDAEALATYRRWLAALPAEHGARAEAVELAARLGDKAAELAIAEDGPRHATGGEPLEILGIVRAGQGDVRGAIASLRDAQDAYGNVPQRREEIERVLARIRASAPDSLRAFLAADSAAHLHPTVRAPKKVPD